MVKVLDKGYKGFGIDNQELLLSMKENISI